MNLVPRLNSFISNYGQSVQEGLARIGKIPGITHVDLNYPEHFHQLDVMDMQHVLTQSGLSLNALNMRFRAPYINGAYTNPDQQVRAQALALTIEALEVCRRLGGDHLIVWLGYDGYDYPFQLNYDKAWEQLVSSFRQLCAHSSVRISIEYKPYEERAFALLDSFGTVSALLQDVGAENLGITLDFCHMLMKKENPAFAASYLLKRNKLFSVHLNDGYRDTDNGLMAAMVNPWMTLEFLYYLKKERYQGSIYFDTFPHREDPIAEFMANQRMVANIEKLLDDDGMERIDEIVNSCDAVEVQRYLSGLLHWRGDADA